MGLFDSIEIDKDVIPFIRNGEGIGIVKIDEYGKCSVKLEAGVIIIKSYDTNKVVLQLPLAELRMLQFDKGNFIQEPKIYLGMQNGDYTLKGVDDNDTEVEHFYNTVLSIKEGQQPQPQPQPNVPPTNGMPQPNANITNPNKMPQGNIPPVPPNAPQTPPQTPPQQQPQQANTIPQNNVQQQNMAFDPVEEIKRYHELYEDGIITEDEFNKKKEDLLNK